MEQGKKGGRRRGSAGNRLLPRNDRELEAFSKLHQQVLDGVHKYMRVKGVPEELITAAPEDDRSD
jgi:hypothetical protein